MDRRLFLAIFLSLLVFGLWSTLVPKLYRFDNQGVTDKSPQPARIANSFQATGPTQELPAQAPSLIKLSLEKLEITFIETQAAIKEVIFKDYQSYKYPLKYGFLLGDETLTFKKENSPTDQLLFVHNDENKKIIKRFIFSNYNYNIELEIEIQNLSPLPIEINLAMILGVLNFSQDQNQARYQDVSIMQKERILRLNARKNTMADNLKFLGIRDRYFCSIIEPILSNNYSGFVNKINPHESEVGLTTGVVTINPEQTIIQRFRIYLGPQELRFINRINPEWSPVVYYGTFDIISRFLLQLLELLYRGVKNWGLAIVVLSLFIYILLFPLTLKQMRSMKQMQTLQPAIEELRKTHKDNPQKLNKEILELYRRHKTNPFGGCLPMVLQIPIFFALYQALMRCIALKGANFLWIKDLSEPDRLVILPISLPILGNEINVLPILMTIGMFIQQKISMSTTSSGSAEQQKLMMIIFPIMFGVIFYHMPAGLVLYWFINSSLMLIYQLRITRLKNG